MKYQNRVHALHFTAHTLSLALSENFPMNAAERRVIMNDCYVHI
jgi:hypothetical protein